VNEKRFSFDAPSPSSGVSLLEIDGLRAVASLSVLVCHSMLGSSWEPDWVHPLLDGGIGVALFFVLSGFLLSLPFLRAQQRGEPLELRAYAMRRMLRILPAYYVSLAFALLFLWPEGLTTTNGLVTVLMHLTLTFGSSEAMVRAINPVYWTLCVEEQFYLVLPLIALLFARRNGPALLAMTLLVPNAVASLYEHTLGTPGVALTTSLPYHWTPFALGTLVAVLFHRYPDARARLPRAASAAFVVVALGGLAVVYASRPWLRQEPIFLQTWGVGWALVLVGVLWGPRWLGIPLRWKPVRALGLMTFSIYLWHFPVAARVMALTDAPSGPFTAFLRICTVFGFTLPFAVGSYLFVERPFMQLRRELERNPGEVTA
jgi:peptidoglycan/LPS O-acetylase OafA/YrhL